MNFGTVGRDIEKANKIYDASFLSSLLSKLYEASIATLQEELNFSKAKAVVCIVSVGMWPL